MINDILMIILKVLVIMFVLIMTRYVLPYIRLLLLDSLDSKLWDVILTAVKSVQQDPKYSIGAAKRLEVIRRVTDWANEHGIPFTEEQLSELIEAAVWTMKHEDDITGGG